ncbi:MAG: ATP-dependent Clp protease adaptor ClpS [Sulfurovum sp.]|uniref:ATP-dependent Clp protease adaptor ClpS n=1 Tax=Sulfurovum sp. TaxID=1969726 RepID=UPI002867F9EB|nr:ATP-dependent Clp protease adaptor ClpS [Sulfurovum sp.]MCO4845268.1 ATP-dependent Clp protease adaptor ClpS [Sulfurovum sp.]
MPIKIKMPITLKSYLNIQFDQPKMYLVSIINDKHVSWEFCMRMLMSVFHRDLEEAKAISHEIVTNGEGFCGGYILEIAETKAEMIETQAKKEGFSLSCLIEEVSA